jgi:hypothetical protein
MFGGVTPRAPTRPQNVAFSSESQNQMDNRDPEGHDSPCPAPRTAQLEGISLDADFDQ